MHTTIAAAADWQFEVSLSEANCKRLRECWSNIYKLNGQSPQKYFWLVTMLQKNGK